MAKRSAVGSRQISVSLPADVIGKLTEIAAAHNMSVAAVARQALLQGLPDVAGAIFRARRLAGE